MKSTAKSTPPADKIETLMYHGARANGAHCRGSWTIYYSPPARRNAVANTESLYAECSECGERRAVNIAPPLPARAKGIVGRMIKRLSRR